MLSFVICVLFIAVRPIASSYDQNQTFCSYEYTDIGRIYRSKLVYDLTVPYAEQHAKRPDSNSFSNGLPADFQTCWQSYVRIAPANFSDIPYNIRRYFRPFIYEYLMNGNNSEIGVLFKTSDTADFTEFISKDTNVSLEYYPDAIAIKIEDMGQECLRICGSVWMNAFYSSDYTQQPGATRIRIGVEINERMLDCILEVCEDRFSQTNFIILNITLSPETSLLTYPSFVKRFVKILNDKVSIHDSIVDGLNEFFFHIDVSQFVTKSADILKLYRAIFAKHAVRFVGEEIRSKIILDAFTSYDLDELSAIDNLDNIRPYHKNEEDARHGDFESSCQISRALHIAGPVFRELVLEIDDMKNSYLSKSCNVDSDGSFGNTPSRLTIKVNSVNDAIELLAQIENKSIDIALDTLYVHPTGSNETNLTELWRLSDSQNITIGCVENFDILTIYTGLGYRIRGDYDQFCNNWFEKHQFVVFYWSTSMTYHEHLTILLEKSMELKTNFLQRYPNGTVHLRIHISDPRPQYVGSYYRFNMYCTDVVSTVPELRQSIIRWAQIHDFVVIVEPLVDLQKSSGWWYNVLTEDELNRTFTDFPVLVRRNAPDLNFGNYVSNWTYACLYGNSRMDDLTNAKVSEFINRMYSGITLNMAMLQNVTISVQLIQAFLSYSFQKFYSVEVRGLDNHLNQLPDALAVNLYNALLPRIIEHGNAHLYIEFCNVSSLRSNLEKLASSSFPPSGIHVCGWEQHTNDTLNEFHAALSSFNALNSPPEIGIVVRNCTFEINSGLQRLKSIPYFDLVNYIVCNLFPLNVVAVNQNPMQYYLDTQLYIHRYIQDKLGIEVIFRQGFGNRIIPEYEMKTEKYLQFMNDTNQYAEGYGIKYFMGHAFLPEELNTWSWWNISDNQDEYAEPVITELASDLFGRPTLQKYQVLALPSNEFSTVTAERYIPLVIGLSVFAIVLAVAMGALWFRNRRMRKLILTKEEIYVFRHGEEVSRNVETIGVNYIHVSTVKTLGFSPSFEISKKYVQLGQLVGEGNFGKVYIANLRNQTEVAVKIPHVDCSKESFKTILAEVKILCYIGKHPNVVSFIGAYTKEIEKGVIYVITEFCPNGSLENYLAQKRHQHELEFSVVEADADCSGYFTDVVVVNQEAHGLLKPNEIAELLKFSYEIVSGMEYIAEKKVVHSDLSTRNVLLDGNMTCKIGDFGLSRKLYESCEYIKKGEEALPWRWMAMESLRKMEFTTKSDVWSFGVTLWEIFSLGETPYSGITWSMEFVDKLEDGLRLSKPKQIPDEIYSKMLECWDISAEKRPTFGELRSHFEKFHTD